jgi:hypothetical protein
MATGALLGMSIVQARRESKHHREQVALQQQILAQQASIKRAQVEAQTRALRSLEASQKRSEAELKRQTAIQERQAALTAEHEFALWRQTPDGRAFLQWVDDKNKLSKEIRDVEVAYLELSTVDNLSAATPEQLSDIDHIRDPVYVPHKPKVPPAQYKHIARRTWSKRLMALSPIFVVIPLVIRLFVQRSSSSTAPLVRAVDGLTQNRFTFWASLVVAAMVFLVGYLMSRQAPSNQGEINKAERAVRSWNVSYGDLEKSRAYQLAIKRERARKATQDLPIPLTVSDDDRLTPVEITLLWEPYSSYLSAMNQFEKWGRVHHPSSDGLPDLHYPVLNMQCRAFGERTQRFLDQLHQRLDAASEIIGADPLRQIEAPR